MFVKKWGSATLFLMAFGLVLGLTMSEGLLRLRYDNLPSLDGLKNTQLDFKPYRWTDWPPVEVELDKEGFCTEARFLNNSSPAAMNYSWGKHYPKQKTLWFAGDSFTHGVGAGKVSLAYPNVLAERLSEQLREKIHVKNMGVPGANFCTPLRLVGEGLSAGKRPDMILVQFFADDLEHHAKLVADNRLILLPDYIQNPVGRKLARSSYTINLIWYAYHKLLTRPSGSQRTLDPRAKQTFKALVTQVQSQSDELGISTVFTVLAPTGLKDCPSEPPAGSRCLYLGQDLEVIHQWLHELEVPYVDLRNLWDGEENWVWDEELRMLNDGRASIGIHPNSKGHSLLADALYGATETALMGSGEHKGSL